MKNLKFLFQCFWPLFGILLFINRLHSPLYALFLHSNLLENRLKITGN